MYHDHYSIPNNRNDLHKKSQGRQDRQIFRMPKDLPNYQTVVRPILEEMSRGNGGLDTIKRQLQELKQFASGNDSKTTYRDHLLSDAQFNNKNLGTSKGINRLETQSYRFKEKYPQERQSFVNISELQKLANFDLKRFYSRIASYILSFQSSFRPPIVKCLQRKQYSFQKAEIFLMLCLMSTFLIPSQNSAISGQSNKRVDFSHIFANEAYKTRCIAEFMGQMLLKTNEDILKISETMTVQRIVSEMNIGSLMEKFGRNLQMKDDLTIKTDKDDIEELTEMMKVDFANKHLGGGALERGQVQEEIMIANRPELYPIMLICQQMRDNEAIGLIGFRKYFQNRGYSDTTTYKGRESEFRPKDYIVAIDATHYMKFQTGKQYQRYSINRELLKAYTGFSIISPKNQLASGNWGCGAFNGDPQLKLIIQWIASSLNSKHLHICPYGKKELIDRDILLKALRGRYIKQVYDLLIQAGKVVGKNSKVKLYDAMLQILRLVNVPRDTDYYPHKDDWGKKVPVSAKTMGRQFKSVQKQFQRRNSHFNLYQFQKPINRKLDHHKFQTNPNCRTKIEGTRVIKKQPKWSNNTKILDLKKRR